MDLEGSDVDALSAFEKGRMGLVKRAKAIFLGPLASLAVRLGVSPTTITLAQIPLALVTVLTLPGAPRLSAALWPVVMIFDGLDGMVANETGTGSLFGKILDQFVDHFKEAILFSGLVFFGIVEPIWGLLYVFLHTLSNVSLYLTNVFGRPLAFAVKPSLVVYPLLVLALWFHDSWPGDLFDLVMKAAALYMGGITVACLVRLRDIDGSD